MEMVVETVVETGVATVVETVVVMLGEVGNPISAVEEEMEELVEVVESASSRRRCSLQVEWLLVKLDEG